MIEGEKRLSFITFFITHRGFALIQLIREGLHIMTHTLDSRSERTPLI